MRNTPAEQDLMWSQNSESALLSAMMLDEDARLVAMIEVKPDHFYNFKNRTVFKAICDLVNEDGTVDPVTLSDKLIERGELDKIGGYEKIGELVDFVADTGNYQSYISNIRSKYTMREMLSAVNKVEHQIKQDPEMSEDMILACAESAIFDVSFDAERGEIKSTKELIMPTLDAIDERIQNKGQIPGTPTGFHRLDRLTGGMRPGQLIIVAGRPAMGKTSFAVNVATRTAISHNTGVAIFSLEMGKMELMERMMASEGQIDLNKIRNGTIGEQENDALARAAGLISSAPIYISDSMCQTPGQINAALRRLMLRHDIGMVMIDYLQLMESGDNMDNRVVEVSKISRQLKSMARNLEVPVVALSQLSRAPEKRENHRPMLSDLRESGSIEQDADVVMFMFREEVYEGKISGKNENLEGKAELIVGKQRNGPVGTITMDFIHEQTRFEERSFG